MGTKKVAVNRSVEITAMYFRNKDGLKTFPRRMEFDGTTYTFRDGLQMLVQKGEDILRVFEMSDGNTNFRLTCDASQKSWTLVDITH